MEATLLNVMVALSAALFGVLCAIIGWVGSRILIKQDEMMIKLDSVKDELHKRINGLDIRLVRVEARVYKNE